MYQFVPLIFIKFYIMNQNHNCDGSGPSINKTEQRNYYLQEQQQQLVQLNLSNQFYPCNHHCITKTKNT